MVFDAADLGCHADGAFGHDHIRARMAELVEAVTFHPNDEAEAVMASLRGPMPDDAWDEDEALEILEGYTDESVFWTMEDGCLVLCPSEDYDGRW